MLSYASQNTFTDVVHLGDILEGDSVSAHNKGKPMLLENSRLARDYEFAGRLLDDVRSAVGDKTKFVLLEGNHEWRVGRYLQEHPELAGMLEIEKGLELKRRNIKLVECYPKGDIYKIGKLAFLHGTYCGSNPCKKHLDVYGMNIVFGHTHEVGVYSKVAYGKGKAHAAYNIGCLCRYDMPYLEGKPTNWQHAFATAYIDESNGHFNLTTHAIFQGEFIVAGKKYSYRDIVPSPKPGKRKKAA
jgi:predicted phosphodiesterase